MRPPTSADGSAIARLLPDIPRWVEARDLLLSGDCELLGRREGPELSVVIRELGGGLVIVVGRPDASAIRAAVERGERDRIEVITPPEHGAWVADALPGWRRTRAILHLLGDPERLPAPSAGDAVGFLDPASLRGSGIPTDLLRELESAAEHSRIAATFVGRRPVSFCYAGAVTETLWDVSIDTLAEYRRRGHAARCASYMIRHMWAEGGWRPVWGAVEENPASWRLARKLGFEPVDELALFAPAS